MNKSIKEQLKKIKDILGKTSSYCIKGNTFDIKEKLKAHGWMWDDHNKYWKINDVYADNDALKAFKRVKDVWIEEI